MRPKLSKFESIYQENTPDNKNAFALVEVATPSYEMGKSDSNTPSGLYSQV